MRAVPTEPMTQAEYLAWEEDQEQKHEYVDGYVYPLFGDRTIQGFAGATAWHNRIAGELLTLLWPAAHPCRTYGSDMRVEMVRSTRYPDVSVTCDERDEGNGLVIRHPKLIVEVLSESTAREDLGRKMREYQDIETLIDYLTIDSRKRWAQIAHRSATGWTYGEPAGGGTLELLSIPLRFDLGELYERVGLPL